MFLKILNTKYLNKFIGLFPFEQKLVPILLHFFSRRAERITTIYIFRDAFYAFNSEIQFSFQKNVNVSDSEPETFLRDIRALTFLTVVKKCLSS